LHASAKQPTEVIEVAAISLLSTKLANIHSIFTPFKLIIDTIKNILK
jgi:hypothetical protein